MPTYYLGSNAPSSTPGTAQWLDTATLGGGAKYNVWQVGVPALSTPIPGTDTTQQAFDYKLTIPAGRIALGDTFNWRFLVQVDGGAGPGGGQFKWGLAIAGAQFLSGIAGIGAGQVSTLTAPNGVDGVFLTAINPVDGILSGTISLVGSFDTLVSSILGLNIAGPVDVEVLWEWQAGTDATATATLLTLGFEINSAVP